MNFQVCDEKAPTCHLCGGQLKLLPDYPVAGQVTSDCRPWQGKSRLAACKSCRTVQKALTLAWHEETTEIYNDYAIYPQADGLEQRSFEAESGANSSRSEVILSWLQCNADLPDRGIMLDIGCGNGAFLEAFRISYPRWEMIGAELDDRNRKKIESIPGVKKLHTGSLDYMQERFDLIVMIHALEHIPGPIEFLAKLHKLLKTAGSLFIQVPNLESSPFDILIVDHCTHYTRESLEWTAASAGFVARASSKNCIAKELSFLADKIDYACNESGDLAKRSYDDSRYARNHLKWLRALLMQAMANEGIIGIFGTSISATWLASALEKKVAFFVDEDINRIGQTHCNKPIFAIEQAPVDVPVIMPIRKDIAVSIKKRLGNIHPNLITPPQNLKSVKP